MEVEKGHREWTDRARRRMGLAGGTAVLAVLAIVALSAGAGAAAPASVNSIIVVAPYSGAHGSPSSTLSTSGCASVRAPLAPSFHASMGSVGFASTTSAKTCPSSTGSSASVDQGMTVSVPLPSVSGNPHIRAHWAIAVNGGESLAIGRCAPGNITGNASFAGCYAYAYTSFEASAYLYDSTTGTYLYPNGTSYYAISNYSDYSVYCYNNSCTRSLYGGPGSISASTTLTFGFATHGLVAADQYVLVTSFYGYSFVETGSYGTGHLLHSSGSAYLNFGLFGDGGTLRSITVS
jgi:hypothetical protein